MERGAALLATCCSLAQLKDDSGLPQHGSWAHTLSGSGACFIEVLKGRVDVQNFPAAPTSMLCLRRLTYPACYTVSHTDCHAPKLCVDVLQGDVVVSTGAITEVGFANSLL